jgi:hypothetical protein
VPPCPPTSGVSAYTNYLFMVVEFKKIKAILFLKLAELKQLGKCWKYLKN